MIYLGHHSIPEVTGSSSFNIGQFALTVIISIIIYKWVFRKEKPTSNEETNSLILWMIKEKIYAAITPIR